MITTHVLDTALGRPAKAVPVTLDLRAADGSWRLIGQGATDADGRLRTLSAAEVEPGVYRISFDTAAYFGAQAAFYPEVRIVFEVRDRGAHCHVPLLLAPYGYSTYRGS